MLEMAIRRWWRGCMKCSSCVHIWFGNHAYPNHAQWHCRIGKSFKIIGKYGSDKELEVAKGCKNFKEIDVGQIV